MLLLSPAEHFPRMFSRCKNAGAHQQEGMSKVFESS